MKILIITQKVDRKDSVLGFFHGWIREFSKQYENLKVICLEKGEYDLPPNVQVLSLGKDEKKSKLTYILRFYKYVWLYRKEYDAVFVHMNQEYILLAGLLWRMLGKKVTMWRNHHAGNLLTDVSAFLCNVVFCTSKFSYTAKYKKTVIMPVGIDTDLFKVIPAIVRKPKSILFLGRISPVKKPHLFVEALAVLKNKGVDFSASIYGDALPKDLAYYQSLVKQVKDTGLESRVTFYLGIPNTETVEVYNRHEVYVNLSSSGMYDKTIFEAMACGCTVFASNDNLRGHIDNFYVLPEDDIKSVLAERLGEYLSSEHKKDDRLEQYVEREHSLKYLSDKLRKIYAKL